MTDKLEKQTRTDAQPTYDPPQALRMGDVRAGTGGVVPCNPGSGVQGDCLTGPSAAADCSNGEGAIGSCTETGNAFVRPN